MLIEHEIQGCGWGFLGNIPGDCKVVFSTPFLSYTPNVPNTVADMQTHFYLALLFSLSHGVKAWQPYGPESLSSGRLLLRGAHWRLGGSGEGKSIFLLTLAITGILEN